MTESTMDYERPAIVRRTRVTSPVIENVIIGSPQQTSPLWRRKRERPRP